MSAATPIATGSSGARFGIVLFLRSSFALRTLRESLYLLLGVPLGVLGFAYLLASLVGSVGLLITFLGVPIIAAAVVGARGIGTAHRELVRRLLGIRVGPPQRPTPRRGLLGWMATGLAYGPGWRALAYLVVKFPLALVSLVLSVAFWGYGIAGTGYALLRLLFRERLGADGRSHRGVQLFTETYLDTWWGVSLVTAIGVLLLVLAPWVMRGLVSLDVLLVRGLLGPSKLSQRVIDLEETRARAVDDSAAKLRRIERDLHDGTQARLVALAMRLGMAKETLDGDTGLDVAQARLLVDIAHRDAKEALVELRDLARGIHPPALDNGLDDALATLAACSPVPVRLTVDVPVRPSGAIETIAYFCVAELLTNVAKHSGSRQATVDVTQQHDVLRLRVTDDGRGGAHLGGGSGLTGLTDRVRTVDGRLRLTSPTGGPTVVDVELPSHS